MAISTLEFYDVGFHHQLVFLEWKHTACVWIALSDFVGMCFDFIVSLETLGYFVEIFFDFAC